jgi:D-proline reductase (dithiol) PrdB
VTAVSAPVEYLTRIRESYRRLGYKPYEWAVNPDPPRWQPLSKPLSRCRLGLVATGGIYVTGQVAFHWKDDTSFRVVPKDVRTEDLRATHFAYDLGDARRDPNVVFPIDTLRRLEREGVIGELADHAFTCMGGIYSTRCVREELAPRLAAELVAERVDAVLLVPV